MASNKSIKKNYIFNLSYQILLLITPLITTPYVSRVLGADGIGAVSYAESIVSYFALFATMGITTYGQREISYVQQSIKKRSVVFWNTKILEFVTSGLMLVVYLVFAFYQKQSIIYIILCCNIVAVFFDISWFFQGLEEFGKIVLRNFIFKFVNIAYIFTFVRTKDDLILYVVGLTVFSALSNISLWVYLPKYITKVDKYDLHPFKDFRVVLGLFIPNIAIHIYTVFDKTMIGIITQDSFENGYYEQAIKISKMVLTVVTALGTVMIPRIGSYFKEGNKEKIRDLMYRGYQFVWFLGIPLCFGLVMLSSNFVPWFFGDGYDRVADLLKVLAFLILAIGISNVTGMQYLIPTGREKLFTITVLIGAGVNFCLNSILIFFFQSVGAAVASVMAESTIAVVQIIMVRKELSPWEIVKRGRNYWIAGAVMVGVLYILNCFLTSGIFNTAILVIAGAFSYFMILLILRDEFFLSNAIGALKKMRAKLKK